jgi:uroporphyrinogen-III synthase
VSAVLILRPEPGAGETARRARALGLNAVAAPLFTIRTLSWEAPDGAFDALLLTSANGARSGLPELRAQRPDLAERPCYCVGAATAAAARKAGCGRAVAGDADGAAAVAMMARDGIGRVLHLCGRDHIALSHPHLEVERRIVYAAEAEAKLPPAAAAALASGALALLHSARAAASFSSLVADRSTVRIAAISPAAARAAGAGWGKVHIAAEPRDHALLELAARLCKTAPPQEAGRG